MKKLEASYGPAPEEKRAYTTLEAARYIAMSASFLRQTRLDGEREHRTPGPPFIKIGRAVRYLKEDLDTWLECHKASILVIEEG